MEMNEERTQGAYSWDDIILTLNELSIIMPELFKVKDQFYWAKDFLKSVSGHFDLKLDYPNYNKIPLRSAK